MVSHSILVHFTRRERSWFCPFMNGVECYPSGFNMDRKTRILLKNNLESTVMVVHRFTGFWNANLNLIPTNRFGKVLRFPGEIV